MGLAELFHPHTPLERERSEFVLIVLLAALLAAGAIVGVAWDVARPGLDVTLPWVVGVAAGAAFVLPLVAIRGRFRGRPGWRGTLSDVLEAIAVLPALFRRQHYCGLAFAATALYWFGDIFCLWACVQAFGSDRPLPDLILAYATGYALSRRTLPLAGAGAVEALLPFALGWSGIG